MMQVILALDIGSSSVRCSAFRLVQDDENETTIDGGDFSPLVEALDGCNAQRKIRSVEPNTGKIILTGESDETGESYSLLDEIDACIDMTLRALRDNYSSFQLVGLGFSTFVMNFIAVDSNGEVIGPEATLSYACNSPSVVKACRDMKRKLGNDELKGLYQKTGAPLHSAYALPQLCALYSNEENEQLLSRIHCWQTIASLCLGRWQGVSTLPISYSEASWTGLLNFSTCEWEPEALNLLPERCRDALPELADYCDTTATIPQYLDTEQQQSNPYWNRWRELREKCRLFLGLGDGACANIGSKCCTKSRIAVTVGTSAAARVCLPLPRTSQTSFSIPPGLFCYRISACHVLVGGALTDGGSVIEWASSLLNLSDKDAFEACMKEVEALVREDNEQSSPSLTVVPFLSGERSTGYRDGATGCVLGLTRETTPARFMKACMEGVMLRTKAILELLCQVIVEQANGDEHDKPYVVASGNAMEKNALWRQMLADASGMDVLLDSDISEGTSRGAALLVAQELDTEQRQKDEDQERPAAAMAEEPISSPTVSSPHTALTEGYWTRASDAQDDLVDAISPLW